MEKVGFGRVRVYPNSQMSGSGMSGIEKSGSDREWYLVFSCKDSKLSSISQITDALGMGKVWFWWVLKCWVRVCQILKKVGFGRVISA